MRVIEARNVQQALPKALALLDEFGVESDSRNGPVRVAPWPVTTVYQNPMERVLFWAERDANPFFHLFESLWMLAGRDDVTPLLRYAKQMAEYSDDGRALHSAYGYRWRQHLGFDQLKLIAKRLRANPLDRRSVLQIWDSSVDLDSNSKDLPCNLTVTFQRSPDGALDMTVFNRSNDIIWGAYGANAVHFSFLQEYLASWIGCPVGVYRQISVNWHGYKNTLKLVETLPRNGGSDPYLAGIRPCPLPAHSDTDHAIEQLLAEEATDFKRMFKPTGFPFFDMAYYVLYAHSLWRTLPAPQRYSQALEVLRRADMNNDWVLAATAWVLRRKDAWEAKQ